MKKVIKKREKRTPPKEDKKVCPVCGGEITRTGRCMLCYSCGWSACGV